MLTFTFIVLFIFSSRVQGVCCAMIRCISQNFWAGQQDSKYPKTRVQTECFHGASRGAHVSPTQLVPCTEPAPQSTRVVAFLVRSLAAYASSRPRLVTLGAAVGSTFGACSARSRRWEWPKSKPIGAREAPVGADDKMNWLPFSYQKFPPI